MSVGHVATGLALKGVDRDLNAGVLVLAAQLLDVLFWLFVLLGLEPVVVPPDFAQPHYLTFLFPSSHGLAATVGWSALALASTWLATRCRAAAVAVALAVLPLPARRRGPRAGAAARRRRLASARDGTLADHMGIALGFEMTLAVVATTVHLCVRRPGRRLGMLALIAVVALITVAGSTLAAAPPAPPGAAWATFGAVAVVSGVAGLLDRA